MSQQAQWQPFTGNESDFAGLAGVPEGEYGVAEDQGVWLYRVPETKALMVRPIQPGEITGVGGIGLGFNPSGNNVVITAAQADSVCAGSFSLASGSHPASIQADIDSWASSGVSEGTSIFVWSGDDQQLYQFVKTAAPGAATLNVCSKGAMAQPGGSGSGITGLLNNMTPTTKALAIGGAVLVVGGTAAYLWHRSKKRRR